MSTLRRDDNTYGMPWVRCAGPLAVCLYQAAEDYCHRELSGALIPKRELEIALPWVMRPGEYDAAIDQLIRVGRFEDVGDSFFLPRYFVEQESDEEQKSSRAKQVAAGKSRAANAKRDANGRMEKSPAKHQPVAGSTSQRLDSGSCSPASGPVLSGPVHKSPPAAAPSPSAPEVETKVRKPRPPREPSGPNQEVFARWSAAHERRYGTKPIIEGSKDGPAVARILGTLTLPVVLARIDHAFDHGKPDWLFAKGPPSLAGFLTSNGIGRLAYVGAKRPEERTEVPDEFTNNPLRYSREEHRKVEEFHARRNEAIARLQSEQP